MEKRTQQKMITYKSIFMLISFYPPTDTLEIRQAKIKHFLLQFPVS